MATTGRSCPSSRWNTTAIKLLYSADPITAETLARRFATDLGGMLSLPARLSAPPRGPVQVFGDYADRAPDGYTDVQADGSAEEGAAIMDPLAAFVVPYLLRFDERGWRPGPWMETPRQ